MNAPLHNTFGVMKPSQRVHPQPHLPNPPSQDGFPQGTQVRIPLRNRAQLHVQRQEGFSVFCFIQCIPFALGWTVVFLDLCLMIWLNFNPKDKITVAFHEDWYWEAICLGIVAGYALFIMCAAGGVIASRTSVRPMYYAWICISLCVVTGGNVGWMIREFNHGHTPFYKFWKICEFKSLEADLKGYVGVNGNKVAPSWMESMQQNVGCCGVKSYEDWYGKFGYLSLPDSCCADKVEGCGDEFFIKDEEARPQIFEMGCAGVLPEYSGMTYKIFHLLLLVKTVETFLFTLNLVIWLFCLRKEYPQGQIRRLRQQIPEVPQPSAPRMNIHEDQKFLFADPYHLQDAYADVERSDVI